MHLPSKKKIEKKEKKKKS
jgi:hypothetical protein